MYSPLSLERRALYPQWLKYERTILEYIRGGKEVRNEGGTLGVHLLKWEYFLTK